VKAKLRSTVAAAMLLAPAAMMFIAEPAAAQRAVAVQPSITGMALNSDAGLSPGATLRARVQATPDARRATLTLGDSGITIALREQGRGTYAGSYVLRRSDRVDPMQLMTARVTHGDRVHTRQFNFPPAFQALAMGAATAPRPGPGERGGPRDQRAPQITDLAPANGDRVGERRNTRISARIGDEGSGIDPDSVRLSLNGQDVTADTRVTDDRVVFRDELERGRYRAELSVRDRAGNMTSKAWTFDVMPGGDRDRVGEAGPLPLEVTSHGNNMVVDAMGNLSLQGRTVPNATVRVQVGATMTAPGMTGINQQVADETVQADRNGYFSARITPRFPPLPGTRYDLRVTATSGSQTAEERLTLIQRRG
jgi:hypothetical protein